MDAFDNIFVAAVSIPFILVGLALIVFGMRSVRYAARSRSWTPTAGKVLASGVRRTVSTSTSSGTTTRTTSYSPEIAYEYNADGQRYVSTQLTTGAQPSDYASAEKKAAEYPIGKLVTVYYDPSDPQQATLEFTKSNGACLIWVGIFMIAFTVLTAVATTTVVGQMFADFMNSFGG